MNLRSASPAVVGKRLQANRLCGCKFTVGRSLAVVGAVAVLLFLLPACHLLPREAKVPLPLRRVPWVESKIARTLIVFLPGRNARIDDYERYGFIKQLRDAGIVADVISTDAHLGYYYKRTIIDRLRDDVFVPARAQGYQRVVVVGISLGGLGALLSQRDLPGSADALVLLSPFLGERAALFADIQKTGGPISWARGRDLRSSEVDEEIWSFLGQRMATLPPTYLSFGNADSLAPGQRLLASLLPAERVNVIAGAHDWKTWKTLWRELCLNSDLFREEKNRSSP